MVTLASSTIPVGFQEHHHPHPHHVNPSHNEDSKKTKNNDNNRTQPPSPPSSGSNNSKQDENQQQPIWHNILAGACGGAIADSVMHPLDTVKTRQQTTALIKDLSIPKVSFKTIFQNEGVRKGLFAGYSAALLGSLPSTAVFFGTYEYIKTEMIDKRQYNETMVYLLAGFSGDLLSSVIYVPSEVLKTRLQLQGKLNVDLYGYTSLRNAIYKIYKYEGIGTFFYGYKATLSRDLPFSALQFAFYEKFRQYALSIQAKTTIENEHATHSAFVGEDEELNFVSELITGASAGGLAGIITTPLDVMKTRIQTNNNTESHLQNNHILKSLRKVFQQEGLVGLFSGVGPRFIWTSIQSSIMLFLYQSFLKSMDNVNSNNTKKLKDS